MQYSSSSNSSSQIPRLTHRIRVLNPRKECCHVKWSARSRLWELTTNNAANAPNKKLVRTHDAVSTVDGACPGRGCGSSDGTKGAGAERGAEDGADGTGGSASSEDSSDTDREWTDMYSSVRSCSSLTTPCNRVTSLSAWIRWASRTSSPMTWTIDCMRSQISVCSRTHHWPGQRAMMYASSATLSTAPWKSFNACFWNQGRRKHIARRTELVVVSRRRTSADERKNCSDICWQNC